MAVNFLENFSVGSTTYRTPIYHTNAVTSGVPIINKANVGSTYSIIDTSDMMRNTTAIGSNIYAMNINSSLYYIPGSEYIFNPSSSYIQDDFKNTSYFFTFGKEMYNDGSKRTILSGNISITNIYMYFPAGINSIADDEMYSRYQAHLIPNFNCNVDFQINAWGYVQYRASNGYWGVWEQGQNTICSMDFSDGVTIFNGNIVKRIPGLQGLNNQFEIIIYGKAGQSGPGGPGSFSQLTGCNFIWHTAFNYAKMNLSWSPSSSYYDLDLMANGSRVISSYGNTGYRIRTYPTYRKYDHQILVSDYEYR